MSTVPSPIATVVPSQPIVYEEAEPITATEPAVVVPMPPAAKRGGCGKYILMGLFVLLVGIGSLVFILSGMPVATPIVSSPTSRPITSSPDLTPIVISQPVASAPQLAYAAIASDDTIRTFTPGGTETVISLDKRNYQKIQLSPQSNLLTVLGGSIGAQNLYLYDFSLAKWEALTIYDTVSTGITGYVWLDADVIIFTQGGWLHKLTISSRNISKLFKINGALIDIDRTQELLLFRAALEWSLPSGNKTDYVFTVTKFDGTPTATVKLEDLVAVDAPFALVGVYFTSNKKLVAELVGFSPETKYQKNVARLFVLDGAIKQEVPIPTNLKLQTIGSVSNKLLFAVVEADRLITLAELDDGIFTPAAYPPPLTALQLYTSAIVVQADIIGFSYTEDGSTATLWYKLDQRNKPLVRQDVKLGMREVALSRSLL